MLPATVARYLEKRAFPGPWALAGEEGTGFAGAVVIPALAESASLFDTLASLAANPTELLEQFLIVAVVNHRADAAPAEQADNLLTLRRLTAGSGVPAGLRLVWVDAASRGRELPAGEGVGLARKLGFDLALPRLDWNASPLLVALDADTLVTPTYLPALIRHFAAATAAGAVLPFAHRPGATAAEEAAIVRYELYLRHYVLGLQLAGSPYAFHTVGSAMACTAAAYVRAGGMNRRTAAEDFYFLQQLARTAGVEAVKGTVVYPSSRPSARVPFGTGRAVAGQLAGETAVGFHPPEAFLQLGAWLDLVRGRLEDDGETLHARAAGISTPLAQYLSDCGFAVAWDRLARNHRRPQARLHAFHGWFDGLRTLRLVRRLGGEPAADGELLAGLLRLAGLAAPADPVERLGLLRRRQGVAETDFPAAIKSFFPETFAL